MSHDFNRDFLEALVRNLAGRGWTIGYLEAVASPDGGGAVTGAVEHFEALRELSRAEMLDVPIPKRFCRSEDDDD